MLKEIPVSIIGLVSKILPRHFSHAEIDQIFYTASAPGEPPGGSKIQKTMTWLQVVNRDAQNPFDVLGVILKEVLEKKPWEQDYGWNSEPPWSIQLKEDQTEMLEALNKIGLKYSRGGILSGTSASPTASLKDLIDRGGLSAVEIEMNRALAMIEHDPNAAVHFAANVLEAALKAYLGMKKIGFKEQTDTLQDLWVLTVESLGINPKNFESKDLKKIASGLYSVVEGTMFLRNKKSGAHGRTEDELPMIKLRPRHARLAIHSAHTLAAYVLECGADLD